MIGIKLLCAVLYLQAFLGQPDVADKVYEAIVVYNLPIQGSIEVSATKTIHTKKS